jgi:hypothetical protein
MQTVFDYVRGLYSLGLGSPFYRHSAEEQVPWPHIDHPLKRASEETIKKWAAVQGNEDEIRREVERLNAQTFEEGEDPAQRPLISNNLYKPNRVTYTSILPLYDIVPLETTPEGYRWLIRDPGVEGSLTSHNHMTPGHCILHEIRIILPPNRRLKHVTLRAGNGRMKTLQVFDDNPEETIFPFLQRYLGFPLVVETPEVRYVTIPFFFSREPGYGLPIFAVGSVEVIFSLDGEEDISRINVAASLEVVHSREEVREIIKSRAHRVEDLDDTNIRGGNLERWVFMGFFWRPLPSTLIDGASARLHHDGGVDEEIRGVFWKISDPRAKVRLTYSFEDKVIPLINFHPSAILGELELRSKILPTTSGSFLTDPAQRVGMGGLMMTKYLDSLDCECGLSPRNGELRLEFDLGGMDIEIYLLVSRDSCVTGLTP